MDRLFFNYQRLQVCRPYLDGHYQYDATMLKHPGIKKSQLFLGINVPIRDK